MVLNKPIYLGQAILDLSKTLMYNFHYGYVKPKYGDRARLLFTDTDSLCYRIQTEDFYKDISKDVPKWFDTSNYLKGHPIGGANKKVLGMMKDEADGESISEFVGLRSKLYAYKMDDGKADKKCKGVKKIVVKNAITFENYKECLFNGVTHRARFNTLGSRRHEITMECITKIALSANDDKRCVTPNDSEHGTISTRLKLIPMSYSRRGSLMKLAFDAINGFARAASLRYKTAVTCSTRTPTSGRGF